MVVYRNVRTGRVVHLAGRLPAMERSRKWERVEPDLVDVTPLDRDPVTDAEHVEVLPAHDGPFNPSEHTVVQVNEHLAGADARERERVLQAEAEGRGRRGILSGPHSDLSEA